jgi:hypothetical protein
MTQLRPPSPPPPSFPSPLTEEDFLLIRQAGYRRQAVRKLATVAQFSAVCILLVAVPALVYELLSPSWVTLMMLIVTGIGIVEYLGHRKLVVGEAEACHMLAINQLVLLGVILIYCVVQIATMDKQVASSPLISDLGTLKDEPIGKGTQGSITSMYKSLGYALYASVAVLSIAFQGGLAWYYHRRQQVVAAYNQSVPEWIQRVFREIA